MSLTVTELSNQRSPAFAPDERGSCSTYSAPFGLSEFCGRYVTLRGLDGGDLSEQEKVSPYLARGAILHKLFEYYHRDPEGPMPTFDLDPEYAEALEESARWWKGYTKIMKRGHLGPALFSEQVLPRTKEEREVVEAAVGDVTFKFVCDSIVSLSKEQIDALHGIDETADLPGPGIYIVDFKTEGRQRAAEDHTLSVQPVAYYVAVDALRRADMLPELPLWEPILGTLFVRLIGNKEPRVVLTFAPPPSEHDVRALQKFFQDRRRQIDESVPNFDACKGSYGGPCWFLRTGKCKRGGAQ